jgi:hypothetical protein
VLQGRPSSCAKEEVSFEGDHGIVRCRELWNEKKVGVGTGIVWKQGSGGNQVDVERNYIRTDRWQV